jgi:hypothetical protein
MSKLRPILPLASLLICASFGHATTLTSYTDRTAFNAATGPVATETFNSFISEISFHTSALNVGPFTISMSAGASTDTGRNKIDIPPLEFSAFNVDGSNVANVLLYSGDSLFLTFDSPLTAFGADFAALNDDLIRTSIWVGMETLTPSTTVGNVSRFFGFTSDTPFNMVEFRHAGTNDGFAIDNVSYGTSDRVPDSGSTLALLGVVLGGGFFARALRRK